MQSSNNHRPMPVNLGDIVSLGPYVHDQDDDPKEPESAFRLPEVMAILPIRNAVAYPGTVMPLAIGRERSKRLLADTTPNESLIGLVTQRNPDTDKPEPKDLYAIGTAASLLKVIKLPQGSSNIIVHGI